MDELRIPTVTLPADVTFTDGRQFPGRLFVPAAAPRHAGPPRASEWLNEPTEFFAFLPDDSGDEANGGGFGDDADIPRPSVEVECAGRRFEGHLSVDMPPGQMRVLDYLNRSERFLTLQDGLRHYLLRKSGITRVFDRGSKLES